MGLDAITSGNPRSLDVARHSHPLPTANTARPGGGRVPPGLIEDRGTTPAERGVPRRLAVAQELPPRTRLRVDEESKQIVAQILDENNEVVRQIPPEALLELSARFNRLEGLLFNRQS